MKYLITFLLIFSFTLARSQDKKEADNVQKPCDEAVQDPLKYILISKDFGRTNYDSSLFYAEKAFELSTLQGNVRAEGIALLRMGTVHYYLGNFKTADSLFKQSSEIFIKIKDTVNYALTLSSFGDLYRAKGETQKAGEIYIRSHQLLKLSNHKKSEAFVLNKTAGLFYSVKQYEKAVDYYEKALEIVRKDNFLPAISALYINIGNVYSDMFEDEKDPDIQTGYLKIADSYYQKAMPIKKQLNDLKGLSTCLINIGLNNTRKKHFSEAIENFSEAVSISEEINNSDNLFKAYHNLAFVFVNIKNYKKALKYAEYVYKNEKKKDIDTNIKIKLKNHQILAEIHTHLNSPKKALFHYSEYTKIRDSLYNTEKLKIINELEAKYQTTIKDQENKILQKENDIQKLQIQKSKIQLLILSSVTTGVILTLIIILLFIRQKKLKHEQKTVKLEQRLLRSQMNPHFIFNSLVAVQSFILTSKAEEGAKYLSKFATLIRLVLQHSRTEFISVEKEIEALKLYLDLQKLRYENKFEYEINEDKSIHYDNYLIPPMLAQPFIENAIEHGIAPLEKKGFIKIEFKRNNDHQFEFKVEDNGVGFTNKANGSHISLASQITEERLIMLNKNKRRKIKLEIKERKNEMNEVEGVTTFFYIPFINKY